jgi:UDP-N-acetylglucosamine 2-epimerase
MYQSTFGITGPPFQLVPDPAFYFDSSHHREVFTELSSWLFGEQGLVVVTGDIGVGKTTLVRTLVRDLDPAVLAVANLVSTQLEADDLVMAAAIGFGIAGIGGGASGPRDLSEHLLRFLLGLSQRGCRAVLIVDEAQNLPRAALERLLAFFTKAPRRLNLQVWLVGQPELRATLQHADSELLRSYLRGSCHLGPLTRHETGAYIEYRLGKVGWNGSPRFEPGAFDEVFRWTRGVPRRINQLCNRLLMAKSLDPKLVIDAASVGVIASELSDEIGFDRDPRRDGAATAPQLRGAPPASAVADLHVVDGVQGVGVQLPTSNRALVGASARSAPILCVASDYGDHVKAAALVRALADRAIGANPERPPATLVRVHDNDSLANCGRLYADLDGKVGTYELKVPEGAHEAIVIDLMTSFAAAIDVLRPCAVVVFDGTPTAFACGTVARGRGVPLVHVGAGLRLEDRFTPMAATRTLTDHLADLLFTTDAQASQTLGAEGRPLERVHCVGSLAADTIRLAIGSGSRAKQFFDNGHGYALALLGNPANIDTREPLSQLTEMLSEVSRVIPIVWLQRSRLHAQLKKFHLGVCIPKDRVRRLPAQLYVDYIALLRGATCVLTDSWNVQEEASALNVPCLTIGVFPQREIPGGSNVMVGLSRTRAVSAVWEYVLSGAARGGVPLLWDGRAGARIASYLAAWSPARAAAE